MRILLDEDLPRRLAAMLSSHEVSTVQRSGWTGIKNGKLLGLAASEFDVFLTMDGNLEFQQNLATLPIAVLVVEAVSNRMEHLVPLVPGILRELGHMPPSPCGRSATPNCALENGSADKQRAFGNRWWRRAADGWLFRLAPYAMNTTIRPETPSDEDGIEQVTRRAFLSHPYSHQTEQFIIRALRADHALSVSLVAEDAGRIAGHIALSPVIISDGAAGWYGLGPIAVKPEWQRRDIGRALMERGLAELCKIGANGCVLVGDPSFYTRLGLRTILLSRLRAFLKSSSSHCYLALLPLMAMSNFIAHFRPRRNLSFERP